jgi:hypothetical protein
VENEHQTRNDRRTPERLDDYSPTKAELFSVQELELGTFVPEWRKIAGASAVLDRLTQDRELLSWSPVQHAVEIILLGL